MNANQMKAEYYRLLRRWQKIDEDQKATMDDVRALLDRLIELWAELHKAGKDDLPYKLAA